VDTIETDGISRRRLLLGGAACGVCALGGYGVGRLTSDRRRVAPRTAGTDERTITKSARTAVQPDGIFRVRTTESIVALTLDDGPDPKYTPRVLDLLAEHRAKATFFLVGVNARAEPALVKRIVDEGHSIGNHTFNHLELELLTAQQVKAEIDRGQTALIAAGAPRPRLFRPPKGYTDEVVGVLADAERYRTVFWDACVEHFVDHQAVPAGVEQMLARAAPGAIILAHDGGRIVGSGRAPLSRQRTMEALPLLLRGLSDLQLQVVDVPGLLKRAGLPLLPKLAPG